MGSDDKKIDISTDDANTNGSAEALQQYLLKQVESNKPILRLRIDGSETSNATGITTEQQNFLFLIDIPLPSSIAPHPIHYSLADSEPAYRGRSTREWTNPNNGGGGKREYTGLSADNTYIKQRDARRARGYPPWLVDLPSSAPASTAFNASLPPAGASGEEVNEYVNQQTAIERTAWKSSQSLSQWAEEYVAATRSKEFIFTQETYGWDMEKLRSLIKEAIKEQGQYSSAGSVDISTSHLNGKIQVRPASTMGKLVSAFGGAGTWKVCGVAYPLVGYVEARFDDQGTVKTMSGLKKRVGMTEEEWFAQHKSTILDAVKKGLDSSKPLVLPLE